MVKKFLVLLSLFFLFLVLLGAGTFALAATNESFERRVSAVPHYARGYLRQWRPTVVPPTPPPVPAVAREELLVARVVQEAATPTAWPTLPPTFTPQALESATPAPSSTPSVTPTPSPSPTPTNTPYPTTPVAPAVTLAGVSHAHQMWNNCGPTTVAMNLSYYGLQMHQREAARFLKPVADDKNVSPEQIESFVQSQGFEVLVRIGGDVDLLRTLLSNGFPVIVETWILPDDHGGMGHYRLLTGYQEDGSFIVQDSFFGRDRVLETRELDQEWRVFNRKFILIYQSEQQELAEALLGPLLNEQTMLEYTLQTAQAEAAAAPEEAFAWHNLGAIYTALGEPEKAAVAFDEARRIRLPLRMLWYQFDMFEGYLAAGRYQDVIDLAYTTAYTASGHEEAYYYRALAHQARGETADALSYLRQALAYNENFQPAALALEEIEG